MNSYLQADEERRALQFGFEGTLARELVDMDVVRAQADPVRIPVNRFRIQLLSLAAAACDRPSGSGTARSLGRFMLRKRSGLEPAAAS